MEIERLHDLFKTPSARWFERLDRGGIVAVLVGTGSLLAWFGNILQVPGAVVVASLSVGLGAAILLCRELHKERCNDLVRQRLRDQDIGMLNAAARAPELPEGWRSLAREAMLERSCGRAMLLT